MKVPDNIYEEFLSFFKGKRICASWKKKASKEVLDFVEENDVISVDISYMVNKCTKELPTCKTCGKRFHPLSKRALGYCSVRCSTDSEEVRRKKEGTLLKRYGVTVPSKNKLVVEKSKRTMFERYGVEHALQRKESMEKFKKTMLERYGVDHPLHSDVIRERITDTHRTVAFHRLTESQIEEKHMEIKSSEEDFIRDRKATFLCKVCGTEFVGDRTNAQTIHCPECKRWHAKSRGELDIYNFLVEELGAGCGVIKNDREIVKGIELDLVVPSKKLAIEYNGGFWHSDEYRVENYHKNKTSLCMDSGIRLIHVFDFEWKDSVKRIKLQEVIRRALGFPSKVVAARSCGLRDIQNSEYVRFLDEYHLQGGVNSRIRKGLYIDGDLVAVAGVGKSRFSKGEWELHRFCTKSGVFIQGGFERLVKHAQDEIQAPLVSYVDAGKFTGMSYIRAGFENVSWSRPNYFYFHPSKMIVMSRYECQKHKLRKLFTDFDDNLSERDNMMKHGFVRIYDSGNLKMVKPCRR